MIQKLARKLGLEANPIVFFASAGLIVAFVVFAAGFTKTAQTLFGVVQSFITGTFGWLYILSVAVFLGFCVWLCLSRYGDIRLGPDDARPRYSYMSWFSMLFSAGMGIGLMFFSVAEPITHFASPPRAEGGTVEAAKQAMNLTFYHWGVHAWGVYCLVGVSLAYFCYRRGLPLRVRSVFYPLLGDRINGPIGHAIDVFAVLGTMFGVATSLGLGVMQVNQGLEKVFGYTDSTNHQLILIACITAAATVSVVTGVDKGIRILSESNLIAAAVLLLFVFLLGPTLFLLQTFVEGTGFYLQNFLDTTFWSDAFGDGDWQKTWTLFYWGWWIAWSPFVGTFIARISYGRTIREFTLGVLFVPTIITFFWLSVFGNAAIHIELFGGGGIAEVVKTDLPVAVFELLENFPWAAVTSFLTTLVIVIFFVTSSDSASLVIDMLTSGEQEPPVKQRIFWAVSEGAVAAVLLYVGGEKGLEALQTASITFGLPFCIILLFMCYSLVKGLAQERGRSLGK